MSSILDDVKHTLGLLPTDTAFDTDVILHTNSVFTILTQLGVGPIVGYEIKDRTDGWEDFTTEVRLNAVKSYIYLRVKLMFDPPISGFAISAMERQIEELEFRLNVVAEYG